MSRPFGIQQPALAQKPKEVLPDRSALEASSEWQVVKEHAQQMIRDLTDHLVHRCTSFEQMIGVQGQIRAYEDILDTPEKWEREKKEREK